MELPVLTYFIRNMLAAVLKIKNKRIEIRRPLMKLGQYSRIEIMTIYFLEF